MTTDASTRRLVLSDEEVNRYREDGYVLLRGVFPRDEADLFRREAHELIGRLQRRQSVDATWGSAREIKGAEDTRLLHCHNVQFHSALFTRLLTDPRLVDPVADLIGPNVQLHHDKLFIKPPEKGSPFPMHQDYPFFPHEKHTVLAAIIHFDDAPLEKGCVRLLRGSHKLGPVEHLTEGSYHLPLDEHPIEEAEPAEARAGDVLIFSYLTIHGSAVNTSDEARTTLLVQMRAPDDFPTNEAHRSRGQGMMLRGIDPTASAGAASS